jgi:hypothetical protein
MQGPGTVISDKHLLIVQLTPCQEFVRYFIGKLFQKYYLLVNAVSTFIPYGVFACQVHDDMGSP